MNIICEGIDRSGKTTLINKLQEDFNLEVIHFTCPKSNLDNNRDRVLTPGIPVFNQFQSYIFNEMIPNLYKGVNTIFDRFLYSDIIYGPIFRPTPDTLIVRPTEVNYLELLMQSLGTLFIFCEADFNTNSSLINVENEGVFKDNEMIKKVRQNYHDLLDPVTVFPKMSYDFTHQFYVTVKDWINACNKLYSNNPFYSMLKSLECFGYYIGPVFTKPEKIFNIPGQLTKPITYDDYLEFLQKNPEYIGNTNIGFVRDKHPISLMLNQLN